MTPAPPRRATAAWLALALVLAVVATYAEVGSFAFVSYDDPDYVVTNPAVRGGLSGAGVAWAFGETHASNWHPLTWLAHMLDVELFGLDAGAHHGMSVAWHALGSVLCFLALRALSGRTWTSALVAGLFALHPLRVESVAWVSERKDVLAGVFFFATLLAYARFARAPSVARMFPVVLAFALGLLAKPMLVSVPFVLLLLDLWPLRRFEREHGWRCAWLLVLEKLPLFLLAGISCLVTVHAQRAGGSLYALEVLPLAARLANAPLAVLGYVARFVWPTDLAYFYPHRHLVAAQALPWTAGALGALAGVLALTLAALGAARRHGAVAVGWLWFLGMLVPVLGLVQVGEQALADRYSYLSTLGLLVLVAYPLADLAEGRSRVRVLAAGLAAVALVACALLSVRQARTWRDSETLYRHALAVTERNYAAATGLANELAARGDVAGARAAYAEALEVRPSYGPALYSLGLLEQQHGDPARAMELYRAALDSLPGLAAAALNLGSLHAQRAEDVEAAQAFERVLELFPEHPDAHFNLALLFLRRGQTAPARPHLERAVAARPGYAEAWEKLGEVYAAAGEQEAAIAALERAVADPARVDAARGLAWILATTARPERRDPARALELARRAVQATRGSDSRALEALAAALAAGGAYAGAVEAQQRALGLIAPGAQAVARGRLERYGRGEVVVEER